MKEWKSPIPLKIHLIWIGNQEYPKDFEYFLQSFFDKLPEFEIKVWGNNDLNIKNFPITLPYIKKAQKLQGKQMIDEEGYKMYDENMKPLLYSKWAQITDLMRLEIIYNHGGYYFDTTFEILKSLYNLLNHKYKFVGCNEIPRFKNVGILSNSFFGAIKKSPILKRLLSFKRLDNIDFYDHQVDFETGPGYLREGILLSDNYYIYPSNYFYPFVEEYSPGNDPPYRKSGRNKCYSLKKKKGYKKVKNGYIHFPCKNYPKSYALKHWQLGKSWLIHDYQIKEDNNTLSVSIIREPTIRSITKLKSFTKKKRRKKKLFHE